MRRALLLVVATGCIDRIDERWQLDHDQVIAARATPPRIQPGDSTNLDALIAHVGRGVSVENPLSIELGSQQADSVEILLTFARSTDRSQPDPVRVKKTVWIGEPADNPAVPPVTIDGAPAGDAVVVPIGRDIYLSVGDAQGLRVNWLTSVGTLFQDDEATSFVHVAADDRHEGELVVVVRDAGGGVAWQVWPMRAE